MFVSFLKQGTLPWFCVVHYLSLNGEAGHLSHCAEKGIRSSTTWWSCKWGEYNLQV